MILLYNYCIVVFKGFGWLLDTLEKEPIPSEAICIKDNTYKIRVKNSSSNRGKSGGYRVYYFLLHDK